MKVDIFESLDTNPSKVMFEWKADDDGTAEGTTVQNYSGSIISVVTKPETGNNKPDANYTVELFDEEEIDLLFGSGKNRSDTAVEQMRFPVGVALGVAANTKLQLKVSAAGLKNKGTVFVYFD